MLSMNVGDKERLAQEAMPMVDRIVRRMLSRFNNFAEKDDIYSYALTGLADAMNKFDPKQGVPFSAYAIPRIKGAVYDGLAQNSLLPRRLIKQIVLFQKMADWHQTHPNIRQLNKMEAIRQLADGLQELAGAYVTMCANEDDLPPSTNQQTVSPETWLDRKTYYNKIKQHIGSLPQKQQQILIMHFFKDMNLSDIAKHFGHSKSWATRGLRGALKALKKKFTIPPPSIDDL